MGPLNKCFGNCRVPGLAWCQEQHLPHAKKSLAQSLANGNPRPPVPTFVKGQNQPCAFRGAGRDQQFPLTFLRRRMRLRLCNVPACLTSLGLRLGRKPLVMERPHHKTKPAGQAEARLSAAPLSEALCSTWRPPGPPNPPHLAMLDRADRKELLPCYGFRRNARCAARS